MAYRLVWCKLTGAEKEDILNILDHTVDHDVRGLIEADTEQKKLQIEMYGEDV